MEFRSLVNSIAITLLCAVAVTAIDLGNLKMGEFSADYVRTMDAKKDTGKMYVKKDRIRMDADQGGKSVASIIRLDKGVMWVMMDNKQYMEMGPVDMKDMPQFNKEAEKMFDIKKLGKEKVNGYDCEVVEYVYKNKSLGSMKQWMSDKLGYPIKTEYNKDTESGFVQELKNIKTGGVSDALFEIPAGYTKFDMMNMMQGGKGMMQEEEGDEDTPSDDKGE
jgi:hypothetical protein